MLPEDDMRYATETCSSILSVLVNNFRLIYDVQLVHLLVCNIHPTKHIYRNSVWYFIEKRLKQQSGHSSSHSLSPDKSMASFKTTSSQCDLVLPLPISNKEKGQIHPRTGHGGLERE